MTVPTVTETTSPPQAVGPDPFIADVPAPAPPPAPPAPSGGRRRIVD